MACHVSWLQAFPRLGYRVYVPADAAAPAADLQASDESATIENRFFRVKLDSSRMAIVSLVDKPQRAGVG